MSSFLRPLGTALCLVCAGCGASEAADSDAPEAEEIFADVGRVPSAAPVPSAATTAATEVSSPSSEAVATEPTTSSSPGDSVPGDSVPGGTDADPVRRGAVADSVDGNRVLVIGDSLMAGTSTRYSGTMCATLGRLGWTVEVDAETGRFVEFAGDVLDQRLVEGFDVAAVMLGNNYSRDPAQYAAEMTEVLDWLAPRPVILFTITEFDPTRAEVNAVIDYVSAERRNVIVVDWAAETASPDSPWLSDDGLHLSDAGLAHLPEVLGDALGAAPATPPGTCLQSVFDDDSGATIPGID